MRRREKFWLLFGSLLIFIGILLRDANALKCPFVYQLKIDVDSCEEIRAQFNVTKKMFDELNPKLKCDVDEITVSLTLHKKEKNSKRI